VDSSCWEQNDIPRQHYAFSNITAIGGLKAFLPVAEAMGDLPTVALIQKTTHQMRTGFQTAFVQGDEVRGTMEPCLRNAMDGALLEGINFAVITDPNQIQSTLSRMSQLKMDSGGYRRTLGTSEYEAHEFLFMNFSLARAHIRLGNPATGDALVERMQHKAAGDNNLIPEMYVSEPEKGYPGPIGAPAGSIPMVGHGAGAYILYLMERRPGGVDIAIA
jgi:GH15 family glucan-1,4-alpha-glucosidase